METNNISKEEKEVLKLKESKKQRYSYAFIYGMLGLLAGFIEYCFILFITLPIAIMNAIHADYAGTKDWAELIIKILATLIALALFFFITRYGFMYGKKRDVGNIPAPKYLNLALVIEILIFIIPTYFLIKKLLILIK